MTDAVRNHYETFPYPNYSLLASVRTCDTYALDMDAVWARFNGRLPYPDERRILLAGCGSFSPYPTSLANPKAEITALDLSSKNLRRARLHAILHGRRNIGYLQGDLLNETLVPGPFGFIDAFGVLHHLADPADGLRALERRLAPGGIIRIMVYSRHARREEESIRRAMRLLGIRDLASLKKIAGRADPSSRFGRYLQTSSEARFPSGLADALLHPRVTTFNIDQLLEMINGTGLHPLLFAHHGALPDVAHEVERLRRLEEEGRECVNFIVYLGRQQPVDLEELPYTVKLLLNPALRGCVRPLTIGTITIPPRLGSVNPPLDAKARSFLRQFSHPRPLSSLDPAHRDYALQFIRAMFLVPLS